MFRSGTGLKLTTLALSTSWKSVTDPVEPTQPKASWRGMPLAFSQVDDGYSVDETVGSVPDEGPGRRRPHRGEHDLVRAGRHADARRRYEGRRGRVEIASTGTTEVARVVPRNGTTGEVVVVAVLLIAQ